VVRQEKGKTREKIDISTTYSYMAATQPVLGVEVFQPPSKALTLQSG